MPVQQAAAIPIPAPFPDPLPAPLLTTIQSALLSSPRAPVPNLQSTLTSDLAASGWTRRLQQFVTDAVREAESESGAGKGQMSEQRTRMVREGVFARVVGEIGLRSATAENEEEHEGEQGKEEGKLQVPKEVVESALRLVLTELERLCVVVDGRGQVLGR